MKRILIIASLLAVAACDPTEEQRMRVSREMPAECTMHDLGSYGGIDRLVVFTCEGQRTVTTNAREHHQCGKTSCDRDYVTVTTGQKG